ncbi:hypothetical protein K2173_008418 [Erythroxylum novogranatense]|uniref:Nudix hydrolase domain-containing protein n=1 Tax=Erythroxylum novogranatense TaxID=1862640 RepID=A0AAV8U905_9ROSI|nr:hypothetical protein K2173_008418 [Erythroxylum novogranatense]
MGCSGNEKMLQKVATQLQIFSQSSNANVKLETRLETLEPVASNLCFVNCREKRAAVLICLFEGDEGEFRVILTKRSMKLSSHPGEVSLPGGKMEEADEDDSATALREAMEEIGLDPGLVQVVANLEPFMSQQQLTVVPVLGLLQKIEDFKPLLNTDEVDAIFDVPLEMFLKEENHRCEERDWKGKKYVLHLFNFESEHENFLIWGLTASILIRAASVIYQRPPCFIQNLPDFQQVQKSLKPEPPP